MKREKQYCLFKGKIMTEPNVAQQVAELSQGTQTPTAAKAGRPKRELLSTVEIAQTCKACGIKYQANQNTYKDGTVVITPPRCKKCQTAHLTEGRVNKVIMGFKHIGNLKSRLLPEQRDTIISVLGNELKVLMDVYAGNSVSVGGFKLV